MGPTIYRWRQETNVVYAWQGPKLVQSSKGTFKRRGAVTIGNHGIGHRCITGIE